jgi:hypothetical protein
MRMSPTGVTTSAQRPNLFRSASVVRFMPSPPEAVQIGQTDQVAGHHVQPDDRSQPGSTSGLELPQSGGLFRLLYEKAPPTEKPCG